MLDNHGVADASAAADESERIGCRVPYSVFTDASYYKAEQERLFRGATWNFVALEAEVPEPGDYKATFIGDTPVVVTRAKDGGLHVVLNRCAHRGAMV